MNEQTPPDFLPPTSEQTVLITGASSGIGLHLAREFARHGHPLVVVAPVANEIDALADTLSEEFGVEVHAMAADLTDESSVQIIAEELEDLGIQVEIVCNNAGAGYRGAFSQLGLREHLEVIRLNVEAVTRLTHAMLPSMLERGHGRIMNTASVAGYEPGPNMAVYHASKAFVLSLTEALATELADKGVTVTALCPGPVDTDFFPKADLEQSNAFQHTAVMSPQEVAQEAYVGVMRGARTVIPGAVNKAMVLAGVFYPSVPRRSSTKNFTMILPSSHPANAGMSKPRPPVPKISARVLSRYA